MAISIALPAVALVVAPIAVLVEGLEWLLGVALATVVGVAVIRWAKTTRRA